METKQEKKPKQSKPKKQDLRQQRIATLIRKKLLDQVGSKAMAKVEVI